MNPLWRPRRAALILALALGLGLSFPLQAANDSVRGRAQAGIPTAIPHGLTAQPILPAVNPTAVIVPAAPPPALGSAVPAISVPERANSEPGRPEKTSALSGRGLERRVVETSDELRQLARQSFLSGNPGSQAPELIAAAGGDFLETAAKLLFDESFMESRGPPNGLRARPDAPQEIHDYVKALNEVLDFAGKSGDNEHARGFVEGAAKLQAREFYRYPVEAAVRIPENPRSRGEYWDLASGVNAGYMMRALNPDIKYRFFDNSKFVVAYLREMLRLMREEGVANVKGVEIVDKDIRQLERQDGLGAIRAKNVTTYVPGFERNIESMTDWLDQGGQLILQSDPSHGQRMEIVRKFTPLARRLIREGWGFEFSLVDEAYALTDALETATFTKPGGPSMPSHGAWESYVNAVFDAADRSATALAAFLRFGR